MSRAYDLAGFTTVVIAVVIAAVLTLIVARIAARHAGEPDRRWRMVMGAMLVANAGVIATATLGFGVGDADAGTRINLEPFVEIRRGLAHDAYDATAANLYGNVAMFVPLGMLLVWLWSSPLLARVAMATTAGVGLSVVIELIQLTMRRVADIDDVILNGTGALLGAVVAAVLVLGVRLVRLLVGAVRRRRGYAAERTEG